VQSNPYTLRWGYMGKNKNRYAPTTINIGERAARFIPSGLPNQRLVTFSKGGQIIAVPPEQVGQKSYRISKKKPAKQVLVKQTKLVPSPSPLKKAAKKKSKVKSLLIPAKKATSKKRTILPYDGPQRFAGGFRLAQGGLPELGKRR
jgi:hypothetical protein